MNLEEVVEAVDAAVFGKTGRHLSQVEGILLQGACQGKTYEQMAQTCQYSLTYLKQAAGPKLWKLLSEVLDEEVSKTNFRAVLERQWRFSFPDVERRTTLSRQPEVKRSVMRTQLGAVQRPQEFIQSSLEVEVYANANTCQPQDWGEAPDVSIFYGRAKELATLEQWIVKERCRLVALVGMGGIGKTTLSVRCAEQIQDDFEYVVWRSLRHAPPLPEILTDLLESFSSQQTAHLPTDLDDKVSRLIDYLHRHRCLIILDSVETLLRRGELAGYYRKEHEGYRELLRRVIETPHQSCLVLTSREKPREIAALSGKTLPVRSLQLTGLQEEAREIFKEKNLLESGKGEELIQLYRGNPLALKIVATTIQELFGGRIDEFFKQNTIVFGDIRDILDEQFERLSALEMEILYWLAIECKPVSLQKLRVDILSPVSTSELIEALESLRRRSLIERSVTDGEALLMIQQPVVTEYVSDQFIKQVCEEIREVCKTQRMEKIALLRNYVLVHTQKPDESVKELQVRLILTPVKDRLCTIFRDERLIEEQLTQVLSMLQGKSALAVGYARENVQNLLLELKADLSRHDFSYNV